MGKNPETRRELQTKKITFHQDNALDHQGGLAMEHLGALKYELLEHPPHSPDLPPCEFGSKRK